MPESNPEYPRRLAPTAEQLLQTIFDSVARIAEERHLEQLMILLADLGRDLISADRCTVWLVDRERNTLWTRVAHGLERTVIPLAEGIAGYVAQSGLPVIINNPYADPRFDPVIDRRSGYRTRNLIALPIRDRVGTVIGVYQGINKMTAEGIFTDSDLKYLLLAATYTGKELETAILQEELETSQREIIFTLAETGEIRSKETGLHVKRVAEYSYLLARISGLPDEECELLKFASPLHDIGKIAIPDAILLKPGRLTAEEWAVMKTHVTLGYDILKHSQRRLLQAAAIIAKDHHEKWNGSGYPYGTVGEQTHIFGRITAVADVFDALGSDRCYKQSWPLAQVLDFFKAERGRHFDPALVDILLNSLDAFLAVQKSLNRG